ncbi:MAG: phosphoglucosamine mutase [Pseudomonas fluorescens]|nr:MAG: phosphoglucosamine mutase [Pseudomonas fluorescens]
MANTKYFGTDGIRGEANGPILRPDMLVRLGQAAGHVVARKTEKPAHAGKPTVVIGKDTRLSGYMIESALQAGFTSVGFTCLLLGPLPTPAVAMLTRSLRADLGVMITASHNPYEDNGIKMFTPDGIKLNGGYVEHIEELLDNPDRIPLVGPDHIGKALRVEDAVGRYIEFVKTSVAPGLRFNDMKIVVDCANGAAYKIAPRIFWELGAEVVRIGTEPNGFNINDKVGATHPATLGKAVVHHGAHLGIALDGDADRLIMVDEKGEVLDGDLIIAAMAQYLKAQGKLQGGGVVATVMSNMGMQRFIEGMGLILKRTAVGDHYVESAMREGGFNLGGEQSGHLIFRDFATTGDGILAALQMMAFLKERGGNASELRKLYTPWPQKMENIRLPAGTDAAKVLESTSVQDSIKSAESTMGASGRVLVRKSGTEPLIRVMVEAESEEVMLSNLTTITETVKASV